MKTKLTQLVLALFALLTLCSVGNASEVVTYYHHDALGSTIAASDDQGDALWTEEYTPYGKRIDQAGEGTNALWFTGKQEELGLSYMQARWYDPEIGRFLSIDPINFDESNLQSFNRYAYANNNPYMYVDPDGNIALKAATFILDVADLAADISAGNWGGAALTVATMAEPTGFASLARRAAKAKNTIDAVGDVAKGTNPDIKRVLDAIDENGYKVKINPKNPATKQEVNATIDFGDKTKVNLRVESHPLKQNGPDVRHANVEVTRQVKNKNKVVRNDHIVD